jgi:hypothetical protein
MIGSRSQKGEEIKSVEALLHTTCLHHMQHVAQCEEVRPYDANKHLEVDRGRKP